MIIGTTRILKTLLVSNAIVVKNKAINKDIMISFISFQFIVLNTKSISNEIPRKPDHNTINIFSPTNRVAFSITLSLNTNLNLPLPEKLI